MSAIIHPLYFGQTANIRAYLSTRLGGVSAEPYAQLNLGEHVGDDARAVAHNRQQIASAMACPIAWLQQVHGNRVVHASTNSRPPEADAHTTMQTGLALAIMVADCLPVLFASGDGQQIAAAHAGWRGLAAGVLENTLQALQGKGANAAVRVYLGPCIGPDSFEVGEDVRMAFPVDGQCFVALPTSGKYLADLPGLAKARLLRAGIQAAHITQDRRCTVQEQVFFSHRRERVTGRQAVFIVKDFS
ncbi:MAG: peptidoglycan editing factor PgeF [Pseudomonadota bacterium]|jgi:YfiH family protein